jgi:Tfp pilus assembly protein PilX
MKLRGPGFALKSRRPRRGATLVLVMACLLVVALLGMALVRAAVRRHRQTRREHQRLQAFWLAESAALRAAARLAADPDYAGETWKLPATHFGGNSPGVVVIRLETAAPADSETAPAERTVIIEARYPADDQRGVMHRRRIPLSPELPSTPSGDTP